MVYVSKNSDEIWLVIDARSANMGVTSSVTRFITGLTCALCSELNIKRLKNLHPYQNLKILLVTKSDPADWIIQLVYKYPDMVSFWNGDARGFLGKKLDSPLWLWPTLTLKKIQAMTGNRVIWFAPANLDRPLFISKKKMAYRVIQVVHHTIPFSKLKGVGFFFKRQFRFLVNRTVARIPYVAAVSDHSAQMLNRLIKKKMKPLHVIADAVGNEFGYQSKIFNLQKLKEERDDFLKRFRNDSNEMIPNELFLELISSDWVLGIGGNQKYKSWDMTHQAIERLNSADEKRKIWFIRVGFDAKDINTYSKRNSCKELGKIKIFENLRLVVLPSLTDSELSSLYRISNLLVHPSLSEGFGLPPIEAALSGLPVLYRKGTAVDDHFEEESLPLNYWYGLESQYPAVWATQIERIIRDSKDSGFYKGLLSAEKTRDFILFYSKSKKKFQWEESANSLLSMIGETGGIIEHMRTT